MRVIEMNAVYEFSKSALPYVNNCVQFIGVLALSGCTAKAINKIAHYSLSIKEGTTQSKAIKFVATALGCALGLAIFPHLSFGALFNVRGLAFQIGAIAFVINSFVREFFRGKGYSKMASSRGALLINLFVFSVAVKGVDPIAKICVALFVNGVRNLVDHSFTKKPAPVEPATP